MMFPNAIPTCPHIISHPILSYSPIVYIYIYPNIRFLRISLTSEIPKQTLLSKWRLRATYQGRCVFHRAIRVGVKTCYLVLSLPSPSQLVISCQFVRYVIRYDKLLGTNVFETFPLRSWGQESRQPPERGLEVTRATADSWDQGHTQIL